jgi:hypothetical protein
MSINSTAGNLTWHHIFTWEDANLMPGRRLKLVKPPKSRLVPGRLENFEEMISYAIFYLNLGRFLGTLPKPRRVPGRAWQDGLSPGGPTLHMQQAGSVARTHSAHHFFLAKRIHILTHSLGPSISFFHRQRKFISFFK